MTDSHNLKALAQQVLARQKEVEHQPGTSLERPRKASALPLSPADWPEKWRERFEERAAIMEFDGGLPRPEAERRAEDLVREAHRRSQERQV